MRLTALAIGVGLLTSIVAPARVSAMSPPANPWFGEVFVTDQVDWPSGVELVPLPPQPDGDIGLEIRNRSPIPLYLLTGRNGRTAELPPKPDEQRLPLGTIAVHRVESGQAFRWQSVACGTRPCMYDWIQNGTSMRLGRSMMYSAAPDFKDRNKRDGGAAGPRRPVDVQLPAPQDAELRMLYSERLFVVPVTLTYVLNPEYERAREQWEEGQRNLVWVLLPFMVPGLILVLGLVVGYAWVTGWMVRELYVRWRRRST